MEKVLISIPNELAARMRIFIPNKQRSKTISHLLEEEVQRLEKELYQCAADVEKDYALNKDMKDWESTISDGVDDGSW
jgi:hypothetical protein